MSFAIQQCPFGGRFEKNVNCWKKYRTQPQKCALLNVGFLKVCREGLHVHILKLSGIVAANWSCPSIYPISS